MIEQLPQKNWSLHIKAELRTLGWFAPQACVEWGLPMKWRRNTVRVPFGPIESFFCFKRRSNTSSSLKGRFLKNLSLEEGAQIAARLGVPVKMHSWVHYNPAAAEEPEFETIGPALRSRNDHEDRYKNALGRYWDPANVKANTKDQRIFNLKKVAAGEDKYGKETPENTELLATIAVDFNTLKGHKKNVMAIVKKGLADGEQPKDAQLLAALEGYAIKPIGNEHMQNQDFFSQEVPRAQS